ncbi:hypothetical protein [Cohnella mopanensis]|nr:hypothetical protein [Cohnella mopanensis]
MLSGNKKSNQPLEIDIRKILEQLGVQEEKWPEEYKNPVNQN